MFLAHIWHFVFRAFTTLLSTALNSCLLCTCMCVFYMPDVLGSLSTKWCACEREKPSITLTFDWEKYAEQTENRHFSLDSATNTVEICSAERVLLFFEMKSGNTNNEWTQWNYGKMSRTHIHHTKHKTVTLDSSLKCGTVESLCRWIASAYSHLANA